MVHGKRYVVFMQGCHLRCKFCHNPDTWNRVNSAYTLSEQELLHKILSCKEYLKELGGGVTFTGGEPLLQQDFLLSILPKLKENNIHVAIDTSGAFELTDTLKTLLDLVDLVLLDVKHIEEEKHKYLTGISNKQVLELGKYLSEKNIPIWIRMIYLPGITDEKEEYLVKLKEYIATLKSVEKIEVLPYHEMGKYKWKELGIEYPLKDIRIPTEQECKKLERYLTN